MCRTEQVQKLEDKYVKLYTNYIDERYKRGEAASQILYDLWVKSISKPELMEKLEDALDSCSDITWSIEKNYIIPAYLPKNFGQNFCGRET